MYRHMGQSVRSSLGGSTNVQVYPTTKLCPTGVRELSKAGGGREEAMGAWGELGEASSSTEQQSAMFGKSGVTF